VTLAVGIDLSGPSNLEDTALAVGVRDGSEWRVADWGIGTSDLELAEAVREKLDGRETDDALVGLDAPLSYAQGGGLREADVALREELAEREFPVDSVMAPTMTRMAYLSLRGIALARLLERELGAAVMEVHPNSALYFRGAPPEAVRAMKESGEARRRLVDELGLRDAPRDPAADSDHLVAALAALCTTADRLDGREAWSFAPDPPAHPYPLVC